MMMCGKNNDGRKTGGKKVEKEGNQIKSWASETDKKLQKTSRKTGKVMTGEGDD